MWIVAFWLAATAATSAGPAASAGGVQVVRAKPTVGVVEYQPGRPPPEMPGKEPGYCAWHFNCDVQVRYDVTTERRPAGRHAVRVRLKSVTVTLSLASTLYLPLNASPALRAHEEGHRRIGEHYYSQADNLARPLAQALVGRTFEGAGDSADAAAGDAVQGAINDLSNAILDGLHAPTERANTLFDDLTRHGLHKNPTADEAVRTAIDRTGPATRPANAR